MVEVMAIIRLLRIRCKVLKTAVCIMIVNSFRITRD